MTNTLQNLIVRDPVSRRVFVVEKDPSPKPAPLTLRRLDREPREQAHVYRTRTEVLGMEILEPRPKATSPLEEAVKAFVRAWLAFQDNQSDIAAQDAVGGAIVGLVDMVEP